MDKTLRQIAKELPDQPGVYQFKDKTGNILYVGKAQSLRKRVSQYFDEKRLEPAKIEMVSLATSIDTIVTKNDTEALALEATLIQRHRPPYNVRLVDDSSYLYIKITNETYPKVTLTRKVLPDGAWYRGPFPNAQAVRQTLKEARKAFPWCAYPEPGAKHSRPCFAFHIGLCSGICARATSLEEYQRNFVRLKKFLDGDTKEVIQSLEERMKSLSDEQKYEQAAVIRNRIDAIKRTMTPQDVATPSDETADVFGIAFRGGHGNIALLQVRHGRIIGRQIFSLLIPSDNSAGSILREFMLQYYRSTKNIVGQIFLPEEIEDVENLKTLLSEREKRTIDINAPQRGWKRDLVNLAQENAKDSLVRSETELQSPANLKKGLEDLTKYLHLKIYPKRIEAYDISNIQGKLATASMIVFTDGKADKGQYRKFKIITDGQPNDVGMMKETLRRRFGRYTNPENNSEKNWPLPDLIILDGGKGQLNAGVSVLNELGINLQISSLAKREEEVFLPQAELPIMLPRTSAGFYLVQRIRDEAHRFTIGYHRLLRKKQMTRSILEEIPGVGSVTRKKLLRSFGSLGAIKKASVADLEKVLGSKQKAEMVFAFLNPS